MVVVKFKFNVFEYDVHTYIHICIIPHNSQRHHHHNVLLYCIKLCCIVLKRPKENRVDKEEKVLIGNIKETKGKASIDAGEDVDQAEMERATERKV